MLSILLNCLFGETKFEVLEVLGPMNSVCGTATEENMFKEVEKTLILYNLKSNILRCVTTDKRTCEMKKKMLS